MIERCCGLQKVGSCTFQLYIDKARQCTTTFIAELQTDPAVDCKWVELKQMYNTQSYSIFSNINNLLWVSLSQNTSLFTGLPLLIGIISGHDIVNMVWNEIWNFHLRKGLQFPYDRYTIDHFTSSAILTTADSRMIATTVRR